MVLVPENQLFRIRQGNPSRQSGVAMSLGGKTLLTAVRDPEVLCHVLSRGNRRQVIFPSDVDRQDFLKTLAKARQKTGFLVHAYALKSLRSVLGHRMS